MLKNIITAITLYRIYRLFHEKLKEDYAERIMFTLTFWSDHSGQLSVATYESSQFIEKDILIFHDLNSCLSFLQNLTEDDICKLRT